MSRNLQIVFLIALLATLLVVLYLDLNRTTPTPTTLLADESYAPLGVSNPALRLDLLQKIRSFEYSGRHRNIFSPNLPPPVTPIGGVQPGKVPVVPPVPPGPPPLELPVKFFGYSTDAATGRRRAFFTDGDDVFIAAEGEMLLSRFRVLRIGNSSVEVEEIASKRRVTAILEELPQG